MFYEFVFLCETSDGTLTVFGLKVGTVSQKTADTPSTNSGLTKKTLSTSRKQWVPRPMLHLTLDKKRRCKNLRRNSKILCRGRPDS